MNENDINRALLIILDGVGVGPNTENNGWALAHTPNIDLLLNDYPSTTIQALSLIHISEPTRPY